MSETHPAYTMSFKDRALPLAALGVPVTPLRTLTKDAFLSDWPTSATTDTNKIEAWDQAYKDCNVGAVATGQPDGVWFFEADHSSIFDQIKADTGFELLDEVKTFMVRSRQGRGHLYFRNTPASLAMGNVPQLYGPFSVRQRNQYVVSANSIHPITKEPYVCLTPGVAPAPAPDWFVKWIVAQKFKSKNAKGETETIPATASGKIPHGFIHGYLVTTAGKLRSMGMDIPKLEENLLELAHSNCEEPLDDDKIKQVARSFERYEPQPDASLQLNLNQQPDSGVIVVATDEELEIPTFEPETYPEFPSYTMTNTSLYDNFVKPICEHNSRIDYFMWMPAMVLLLNYLGTKIQIKGQFAAAPFNGSLYLGLIGRRGDTNKSSSIDDAMQYFQYMGLLTHNGGGLKTAEGKSVLFTPGSSEGMGIEMQKTNCKNAVMHYDELKKLVAKAGIDGSSLGADLLTLYESKKYGNSVKKGKEAFSLEPNSYCASLITSCTDAAFKDLWTRMCGEDTGLNDRFTFALQPQILPRTTIKIEVPYLENAVKTRFLIDKAVQQKTFEVENWNNAKLQELVVKGARYTSRAFKWALAIAIDMGLNIIDDECLDRGVDLVHYEIAVKDYLRSDEESETREGALQLSIMDTIRRFGNGSLPLHELERRCNKRRKGTTFWAQAFYGLQKDGSIRVLGKGTKTDPRIVQLLKKEEKMEAA